MHANVYQCNNSDRRACHRMLVVSDLESVHWPDRLICLTNQSYTVFFMNEIQEQEKYERMIVSPTFATP